jgi:hypothetical protein
MLAIGAFLFPSSGRDDVHIGYWAAWTLAEHGEILNYTGDRLEQSSTLLHTLLLAALAWLTRVEIASLGTPLSALFGVLAVIEAGRLASRLDGDARWALAFAATATPLVYWSFGALESTLVAYVATAFVRALCDYVYPGNAAAGAGAVAYPMAWAVLFLLVRPEAVFVLSAFMLSATFACLVLFRDRSALPRLGSVWALSLAAFAAIALWRHFTFGAWFPQPVSAKVDAQITNKLAAAAWYFGRTLRDTPVIYALIGTAAAALALKLMTRDFTHRRAWIAAGFVLAQLAFIVAAGGDWMEGGRFLVPMVPAVCALAAWALTILLKEPARRAAGVAIVLAELVMLPMFTLRSSTGVLLLQYPAYRSWAAAQAVDTDRFSFFELANRVHLRDALFLPHVEAAADSVLAQQATVTVMSVQGGMVPYHLARPRFGRLRFIDMGGLASRDFSDCPVLEQNPNARGAGGISMTDAFYLEHMDEFRGRCGIPIPDLYYNIDDREGTLAKALEATGRFKVVYRQHTNVCAPGTMCPRSVQGDMVLGMRTDL